MRKLFILSAVIIIILFLIKRNDMTWRQSFLKTIYPLIMLKGKWFPAKKDVQLNTQQAKPVSSLYDLTTVNNHGDTVLLSSFRGKKLLIVNTASNCGYTAQYDELEKLYRQYKDKLEIIAFPANDFKEQEKADDAAIEKFCKLNYGVSFPLMKKAVVVKTDTQHPIFKWLSDAAKNGWCNQVPIWNFSKYLIDENGVLLGFFSQNVSPGDGKLVGLIGVSSE
jgi:glutathione peroxidase